MSDGRLHRGRLPRPRREPVVLARPGRPRWKAPHFVWAVRDELARAACGEDATTCDELERGRPPRHHDARPAPPEARREVGQLAAAAPHHPRPGRSPRSSASTTTQPWSAQPRDKDVRNGALVAMDYQTGEIVAYVGSADYYSPAGTAVPAPVRRPEPGLSPARLGVQAVQLRGRHRRWRVHGRHDAHGQRHRLRWRLHADRRRQPRAGSGPRADALQFSLNIPSVKAMGLNGPEHVFERAKDFGMTFQSGIDRMPGGARPRRRRDPTDRPRDGLRDARQRWPQGRPDADPRGPGPRRRGRRPYDPPEGGAGRQRASGVHRHRHPQREHDPRVNPFWGRFQMRDDGAAIADRRRSRPARTTTRRTSTPTATSRRRPRRAVTDGAYALAVGVWNGNSDNTPVSTPAARLLHRCLDVRLAGLPEEAPRLADHPLRAARRSRARGDRPVHRCPTLAGWHRAAAVTRTLGWVTSPWVGHRADRSPGPADPRRGGRSSRWASSTTSLRTGSTRARPGSPSPSERDRRARRDPLVRIPHEDRRRLTCQPLELRSLSLSDPGPHRRAPDRRHNRRPAARPSPESPEPTPSRSRRADVGGVGVGERPRCRRRRSRYSARRLVIGSRRTVRRAVRSSVDRWRPSRRPGSSRRR